LKRKLVLKRLSASDLTLFEHHYRNTPGAKQKALNLDAAVFVQSLYPGLSETIDLARHRIPLNLSIYGPGGAGLHNLQRKILKQQKNWRLNGELIYDPPEEVERYAPLKKGDYAILEFSGDTEPDAASLYLIAGALPADVKIYQAIEDKYANAFSSRKGMEALDADDFTHAFSNIGIAENHPFLDLIDQDILEDAAVGGFEGIRKLKKRRQTRGVSQEELNKAKRSAELVGRLGEEILNGWLETEKQANRIRDYRWISAENAIAPYDFELIENSGLIRNIDAKSTAGDFKNPIHISIGELYEMTDGKTPYDLYRLYMVTETSARLSDSK
jgi:transcriptional regulator with XRE-family HTH domain